MRVFYDRRGRVQGFSTSVVEGQVLSWAWVLCLPLTVVLYYFPRAVWRSRLSDPLKLALVVGVWGALIAIGALG